mgnify:CR=1 FL=1
MKDRRDIKDIKDFSGGQITNIPITSMEGKYSPDCIDVYAEGTKLRRRKGYSPLNTSTVGTGLAGNGIFNWVKSATEQLLMSVFGNKLYKMDLSGTAWDGTFDLVSAHATSGQAFADTIIHFNTYAGTLLWTTENRDHPQKMLVTDASHFDIESGGAGVAPNGKYNQIWKEHVWILNIGAGGALEEDCASIADWTDSDTGAGASTQSTFQSLSTFRFLTAGSASHAQRVRDIGTLQPDYVVEMKTYFDEVGTIASTAYADAHFDNAVIRFQPRFSEDGLEVYDGDAYKEVGVNLVSENSWNVWKFVVTGGTAATAKLDVLKDGVYVGLGIDISSASASTASGGEVMLRAFAGATTNTDWYLDYININNTVPRVEYFTDSQFSAWNSATVPTSPNLVAEPVQPLTHIKCNDNAASTVATNVGSEGADGVASVNTTALSSAGKISNSFSFTSASSHNIALAAATVTSMSDDSVGSLSFWFNADVLDDDDYMFSISNPTTSTNNYFKIGFTGAGSALPITIDFRANGSQAWIAKTLGTVSTNSWHHLAVVQNGVSPILYLDGSSSTNLTDSTNITKWFAEMTSVDNGYLAATKINSTVAQFFDGRLDDFRYYSSALNSFQIATIYADGSGTEAQATTAREGTTFYVGTYAYQFTNDSIWASGINQTLTNGSALAGVESVIGGFFAGTNTATWKLRINDGTTNTDSSVFTTTGTATWQYQTLQFTPTSGAGTVRFQVISTTAGTINIDYVSVRPTAIGALSDNADRIQRSAVGLLDNWSGTDSGTNDITTPGDIGLTGSFILNDRMYVTKKYSISRFTYTGSTPLVDIKTIRTGVGTQSPRSIKNVVIPGEGEVVLFLGTDRRLYKFDGFDSQHISSNIDLDNEITLAYFQNINTQALNKVFAVIHNDNPWYELFVCIGSSVVPNYSIVYDYAAKSFWPFANRNFKSGNSSDNGTGQSVVYVQGNTTGIAYLTNSTNTDGGSAIDARWVSPKLGDSTILSKMDEINVESEVSSSSPTFSWREDFNSTYTSVTMATGTNKHNYNPKLNNNYIQYRIVDATTADQFSIWSLRTLSKAHGHAD